MTKVFCDSTVSALKSLDLKLIILYHVFLTENTSIPTFTKLESDNLIGLTAYIKVYHAKIFFFALL